MAVEVTSTLSPLVVACISARRDVSPDARRVVISPNAFVCAVAFKQSQDCWSRGTVMQQGLPGFDQGG